MNTEKLFWSIFKAKEEDALYEIVMRDKLLSDNNNWFPYGGRDKHDRSNFGTFENQQANPVPALATALSPIKPPSFLPSSKKLLTKSKFVLLFY